MAYSNFINNSTQIKFFSGSQADLTPYIKGTTQAQEGAFYLTTDTQKLYVGRKNTTDNKVYAVQVSRGVTFVATSGDLPTPGTSDIEEGELYYITSSNVLAALIKEGNIYKWTQVNPPTGVDSVDTSVVNTTSGGAVTDAAVNITINSQGDNSTTGKFHLIPGSNITIASGSTNSNKEGTVTITAKDTLYDLGTTASATSGIIKLSDNNATPGVDNVTLTGAGSVKVTSNAAGAITITGATATNIQAQSITNGNGFKIDLNGTDASGSDFVVGTNSTGGTKLDPIIAFGNDSSNNTTSSVHFVSGTASLPVYTAAQTDAKIEAAIDNALQVADALTYQGAVTSGNETGDATSLKALVDANGARNGDVYKVANNSDGLIVIDGVTADVGDLIILHGTEGTNGQIDYNNNLTTLLSKCQLIPSGDEPEVAATVATTGTIGFELHDSKNGDSNLLNVRFQNGQNNNIIISGTPTTGTTDGKSLTITANHPTITRVNTDIAALPAGSASDVDTIGTGKVRFFVLGSNGGLETDSYGHVTKFQGKLINFKHNTLTSVTPSYASTGISLRFQDGIGSDDISTTLNFASDTLQLTERAASGGTPAALKVDLTWGTF